MTQKTTRPGFNRLQRWLMSIAGIGIAGYLMFGVLQRFGSDAGAQAADESRQRLELVWPDVMAWPDERRAFVVGLAMTCRLQRRDLTREAAVACLERAAADPRAYLPHDVTPEAAPALLARLLQTTGGCDVRLNPAALPFDGSPYPLEVYSGATADLCFDGGGPVQRVSVGDDSAWSAGIGPGRDRVFFNARRADPPPAVAVVETETTQYRVQLTYTRTEADEPQ